jgi:hypothetical protein
MKHEIDEATRAGVRSRITQIAKQFHLSRKDAESLFRRNLATSEVGETLMETIKDDIAEQKEHEAGYQEYMKTR